jgi:hypothetical protein
VFSALVQLKIGTQRLQKIREKNAFWPPEYQCEKNDYGKEEIVAKNQRSSGQS